MKQPHKHAELIKQWADGAEIEFFNPIRGGWQKIIGPSWDLETEYRIKPEQKPDVVWNVWAEAHPLGVSVNWSPIKNLRLTFDGETGKLKDAEVLK